MTRFFSVKEKVHCKEKKRFKMSRIITKPTCHFCSEESCYSCPKCNAFFCSSACYNCRAHINCSESFYKGLVEEKLKSATASNDSNQKMQEILMRLHDGDEEDIDDDELDSDDDEDIVQRLKGIDLDDSDAVWSKLSQTEQSEFLDLMKDGELSHLIPPWKAWWDKKVSVTELTKQADKEVPAFIETCPSLLECPPLSLLMKGEPSLSIPFNILNVLASYVWTVRIFNGDHQENCIDATETLMSLSPVLSAGACYSSRDVAVNTPKTEAQKYSWICESEEFSLKALKDVETILNGPNSTFRIFYITSALSDIHSLFVACKQSLHSKKKERSRLFSSSLIFPSHRIPRTFASIDLIKKCVKKIEFFLSYIKEYPYKLQLDK